MKKLLKNICLSTAALFIVTHISIQAAAGSSYGYRQPSVIHAWANNGTLNKLQYADPHLLQQNIDKQNDQGYTPLALAAMNGHLDSVRFLLSKNANPIIPNNLQPEGESHYAEGLNTPLHWIARRLIDQREIFKVRRNIYYEIGKNILNKITTYSCNKILGHKLLSVYRTEDQKKIVCKFIIANQRNGAGANPLHALAGQHRLNKKPAPTEAERGLAVPTMYPAKYRKEKSLPEENRYSVGFLEYLIANLIEQFEENYSNNGTPLQEQDNHGMTPLHWAAMNGFAQTAGTLIKHGAKLNTLDKDGKTPLHWAALKGHKGVIEELLQADDASLAINKIDKRGRAPLHWVLRQTEGATGYGRGYHFPVDHAVEIMKLLIKHGADPMIEDADGHNLFYWLHANEKTRDYVENLLTLYSKVSATGKPKTSYAAPSSAAASSTWTQAPQAAPMAQPPTVHSGAVSQKTIEELKKAIDEANITQVALLTNQNPKLATAKDSKGMQPLYYLATKPIDDKSRIRAGIAALLIMRGAHNDAATYEYMSPLAIAATQDNSALVDMLLKKDDAHITTDELIVFRGFTTDENVKELLGNAYAARLRKAALNNDIETFKHLLKLAQDQKITADQDIETHLFKLLIEIYPKSHDGTINKEIVGLLKADHLATTIAQNHISLVRELLEKHDADAHITTDELIALRGLTTSKEIKELLGNAYAARLRKAALKNDIETFKHLLKLAKNQKITADQDIETHLFKLLIEIYPKSRDGTINKEIADLLEAATNTYQY